MAEKLDAALHVPNIDCEKCGETISKTLNALPGVEHVTTDIPAQTVRFRYDQDQTSMHDIQATLDEAGYPVSGDVAN